MKVKRLNLIFFLFFALITILFLFNKYSPFSVGAPRPEPPAVSNPRRGGARPRRRVAIEPPAVSNPRRDGARPRRRVFINPSDAGRRAPLPPGQINVSLEVARQGDARLHSEGRVPSDPDILRAGLDLDRAVIDRSMRHRQEEVARLSLQPEDQVVLGIPVAPPTEVSPPTSTLVSRLFQSCVPGGSCWEALRQRRGGTRVNQIEPGTPVISGDIVQEGWAIAGPFAPVRGMRPTLSRNPPGSTLSQTVGRGMVLPVARDPPGSTLSQTAGRINLGGSE